MDIAALRRQSAEEILGGGAQLVAAVNNAFPHWSSGYDMEGRPVCYIEGCNYDGRFVFEMLSPDTVLRYHVWRTEKTLEAYYTKRVAAGEVRGARAPCPLAPQPVGTTAVGTAASRQAAANGEAGRWARGLARPFCLGRVPSLLK